MQLSFIILSCVVACGLSSFGIDARYIKRDAETVCPKSVPCGWEVYRPYSRSIIYFVESPCKCPDGSRCTRTTDDITIPAYVHRCVPEGVNANDWKDDYTEEQN